ncbi:hypothetical protein KPH14_012000 [Odynerus spinipes]|uniref:Prokaryotic-type class I peptide chain release factors domain-containing protein n=1 Tax=Odynerus spinipes TaxID=1348599 RepID=A0AAD9RDS0_9HYME|nr:hypothetical protein KPH14_012000 [Odynerus spinipes]
MNAHFNAIFLHGKSVLTRFSPTDIIPRCIDRKISFFHTFSLPYGEDKNSKSHPMGHINYYNQQRLKSFKRYLDYSKVPTLDENDLEEQFVRGSGPGGQATNKTNNAVTLKHKSTGIVVRCHETRSLCKNQERAREIMIAKLDNLLNGDQSIENQERLLKKKLSIKKEQKQKKLADLKKSFKMREGLE